MGRCIALMAVLAAGLLLAAATATGQDAASEAGLATHGRALLAAQKKACSQPAGPAYANEQVADPSKTCVYPGPNYDSAGYCDACYLYQRHSQGAGAQFVETGTTAQDHFLVLPTQPCSGVEMFDAPACGPGDAALDHAWALLTGPEKATKGVGVNGNHRRTQHQLHIHVADVQSSLLSALNGLKAGAGWTTISCSAGPAQNCKATADPVTDRTPISAKCEAAATPSAARAMEQIYEGQPQAAIWSSMLVTGHKPGELCLARATDLQVECLLYFKTDYHC